MLGQIAYAVQRKRRPGNRRLEPGQSRPTPPTSRVTTPHTGKWWIGKYLFQVRPSFSCPPFSCPPFSCPPFSCPPFSCLSMDALTLRSGFTRCRNYDLPAAERHLSLARRFNAGNGAISIRQSRSDG